MILGKREAKAGGYGSGRGSVLDPRCVTSKIPETIRYVPFSHTIGRRFGAIGLKSVCDSWIGKPASGIPKRSSSMRTRTSCLVSLTLNPGPFALTRAGFSLSRSPGAPSCADAVPANRAASITTATANPARHFTAVPPPRFRVSTIRRSAQGRGAAFGTVRERPWSRTRGRWPDHAPASTGREPRLQDERRLDARDRSRTTTSAAAPKSRRRRSRDRRSCVSAASPPRAAALPSSG
jgi:hypothetical protein